MKPANVLHVLDHSLPLHSGYVFRTQGILQAQRELGLRTFHVTGPKQGVSQSTVEEFDGYEYFRSAASSWMSRVPLLDQVDVIRSLSKGIVRAAAQVQPNLLHAHSPCLNGAAALIAARELKVPVVYEVRAFWEDAAVSHGTARAGGPRYQLTRGLESWVMRRADAVTTICHGLRDDIIERGIAKEKLTVVGNAVDQELSFYQGTPANLAHLPQSRYIGFLGSFYEYEGLELLIAAMTALKESHPDVGLLLVGGGQHEDFLKQEVARLSLQDRVHFLGRVPHEEIPQYYSALSALVFPRHSMRLTELVTPLKPIESMLAKRIVVASDVGGHRELVSSNETGLLFRPGDVGDLVQKVRYALDSQADVDRMIENAYAKASAERRWEAQVQKYLPVYSALLGH